MKLCSWAASHGWTLGTWDADPKGKRQVGAVVRTVGSTRKAKVFLNVRPGSGLKPGK